MRCASDSQVRNEYARSYRWGIGNRNQSRKSLGSSKPKHPHVVAESPMKCAMGQSVGDREVTDMPAAGVQPVHAFGHCCIDVPGIVLYETLNQIARQPA